MLSATTRILAVAAMTKLAMGHISIWTPAMWGFNVTQQSYSYDNRPQTPLQNYDFNQWWFHGHLDHPPNAGDIEHLTPGGTFNAELSCDKGSTSHFASSQGGNAGYPTNSPCIGQPMSEYHTTGINDLMGCALGITYKSDVNSVQPEDFAIFSVNHTCVWELNTKFQVPSDMPACPEGGCICAWFWIHSPDSGSEQMYMNGFRCDISGAHGTKSIGKPAVARRCGADPANGRPNATPSNCTVGPKQPLYWYQNERNNMFEGQYSPPIYHDLYGFNDGAQTDIFQEATVNGVAVYGGGSGAPSQVAVATTSPTSTYTPVQTTPASQKPYDSTNPQKSAPANNAAASSSFIAVSSSTSIGVTVSTPVVGIPSTTTTSSAEAATTTVRRCKQRKNKKRSTSVRRHHARRHLSGDNEIH
ncbi:Lytic polysaccharide monooxygenase AA14 [Abortiporus biennis]